MIVVDVDADVVVGSTLFGVDLDWSMLLLARLPASPPKLQVHCRGRPGIPESWKARCKWLERKGQEGLQLEANVLSLDYKKAESSYTCT